MQGFLIIESYSQSDVSKVQNWLPQNVTIFATYYVATYNHLSAVRSGPVRDTIIVQILIRTKALSSIKFETKFEDTLDLGNFLCFKFEIL